MMVNSDIRSVLEKLLSRPWDEDLTEEEEDSFEDMAAQLVSEYGWESVYTAVTEYLQHKCNTPEAVVNFAHQYWGYGWCRFPVPDPYRFLGYLYYRIDLEPGKYDATTIMDGLTSTILPKAGFTEANMALNTRYVPELDPKIIAEVERFRKSESTP